jgi:glutaredoxin 2
MHDIPTLRILDSCFVAGTKDIVHHVQLLQNGDVILQWMSNEDLNEWRRKLYGYTINDGVVSYVD